ncbi:mechanosensitive ion channel family protein [Spartinivicinus poritis]|uniref:Small-conductance mechanosensitive channel n=1 Tax=Spartinivicinus poritis TaxID=2994640 RepID=A0ABT5UCE7_9GAMM|nr:mechanosensitive ion channel family protein [Spartinivicinus sp. A2-2]MDE1464049.1 mechanosensitive ion channel family protein [Spartinivicinus sp. A2-2]
MDTLRNLSFNQIFISIAFIIVGFILAKLATKAIATLSKDKLTKHQSLLFQRISYYLIIVLFIITALQQINVDLGVILGAAGILSVAIGFASQTSASNIISGLFLLGEKPFGVGDVIKVGSTTGEVLAIDLLSIKLRTFDNLFVRIPNETIIKSEVTTLTRFPIRRFDLVVGVAYKEDLTKVKKVLLKVADDFQLCLEDPEPLYLLQGFGDSAINIQLSVWAKREDFLALKNGMIQRVKSAFDENNIEIPFPHRTIYTGLETIPFPITQQTNLPCEDNPCQT